MKQLISLVLILFCITSCRTINSIETVKDSTYISRVDTVYEKEIQKDSIYIKDSIYVLQKGDTVLQKEYKYIYVTQTQIDTVVEYKDRVVYKDRDVYKEKEVEVKYIPKWMKICTGIGIGFILLGIVGIIILIYKKCK